MSIAVLMYFCDSTRPVFMSSAVEESGGINSSTATLTSGFSD
ncbi:MAG: hypothetical protein WBM50_02880 [Acidimicrobiales bacterium]